MVYVLGQKSLDNMVGLHPKAIFLIRETMKTQIMDFGIGDNSVRTVEKQKENIKNGVSWTMNSKHIIQPDGYSHAFDAYPYPIDMQAVRLGRWQEIVRFGVLNGIIQNIALTHGIKVKWGCDWDGDGQTLDHTIHDAPHWELIAGG